MHGLPYDSETIRWILLKFSENYYYVAYRFSTFYQTLSFTFFNSEQFWTQIFFTIVFPVRMGIVYTS